MPTVLILALSAGGSAVQSSWHYLFFSFMAVLLTLLGVTASQILFLSKFGWHFLLFACFVHLCLGFFVLDLGLFVFVV